MSELVDAHPCPNCGSLVHRVRRQLLDRLISNVAPRHRYRCSRCGWTGVRRGAGRSPGHQSSGIRRQQIVIIVILIMLTVAAGLALTQVVLDRSTPSDAKPKKRSSQVVPPINPLATLAGGFSWDRSGS